MTANLDPRFEGYIERSAAFAQPVLRELRRRVHRACPGAVETLKWGMPHFLYGGSILCGMAGFKQHCTFGYWHQGMEKVLGVHGRKAATAMGNLGRIAGLADLPPAAVMHRHLRAAMKLIDSGTPARPPPRSARKERAVPADLAVALAKNAAAAQAFRDLSPSHRREYLEWIEEAKRGETRARRLATTLAWLSKGKSRNWKYR